MLYFSAVRPDWNVEKERMARGVSLSENCQEGELERCGGVWWIVLLYGGVGWNVLQFGGV